MILNQNAVFTTSVKNLDMVFGCLQCVTIYDIRKIAFRAMKVSDYMQSLLKRPHLEKSSSEHEHSWKLDSEVTALGDLGNKHNIYSHHFSERLKW